jgi:hypothetical protein
MIVSLDSISSQTLLQTLTNQYTICWCAVSSAWRFFCTLKSQVYAHCLTYGYLFMFSLYITWTMHTA